MSNIRLGVQLSNLRLPLKEGLQAAARLGVQGVEIDARQDLHLDEVSGTALRQIRKMLDDFKLRVAAVRFQTRRGYDCADDLDRRVDATKRAFRFAQELGSNIVVNQIGYVQSDHEAETMRLLRDVMSDLGRSCQHFGVMMACETGSESLEDLLKFIQSLDNAYVGIALNPGNLFINGFDLQPLSAASSHIVLVHVKDGVRDRARGRGTEVPLGQGLAEFPDIIGCLAEQNYQGFYIIERESSKQPLREIAEAVEFMRNVA